MLRDLSETADIKIEMIANRAEAQRLVTNSKRAAVLVLGKSFSKRVERCSFLTSGWRDTLTLCRIFPRGDDPMLFALSAFFQENQTLLPLYLDDGINPFYRDGVKLDAILEVEGFEGSHAANSRRHHRSGCAGIDAARGDALDDRTGFREDRRSRAF